MVSGSWRRLPSHPPRPSSILQSSSCPLLRPKSPRLPPRSSRSLRKPISLPGAIRMEPRSPSNRKAAMVRAIRQRLSNPGLASLSIRRKLTAASGCVTCKSKRLKCDETKPMCQQCQKRNVTCGGYKKDFKWRPFGEAPFQTKSTASTEQSQCSHCWLAVGPKF